MMEILEVAAEEYRRIIPRPYHVFNSVEFGLLNRHKCDDILFLLFRDRKYHLGLVGGLKDGVLASPFSAPYGGFSYVRRDTGIPHIDWAVGALLESSRAKEITSITMTVPPLMYETSFISKMINCLFRHGFVVDSVELNHALDLRAAGVQGCEGLSRDARRLLKMASGRGMTLRYCDSIDDKRLAFQVIERSKQERGYPQRMTWEQVKETISIIKADFFLLTNSRGPEIASAMVFHVQEKEIAQVVYWGDIRENSEPGAMDYLAVELGKHYSREGFKYLDLGRSSEDSLPNYGLCRFKESLGCVTFPKISMTCRI